MNIIEKIKNKMSWVDKLGITLVVITAIGAVLSRIGFQFIGNTICGICFGVVVVAIVFFVHKVTTTNYKEGEITEK